jgi:hypothetical protein
MKLECLKECQKELKITNIVSSKGVINSLITGTLNYKNYAVGTIQLKKIRYPHNNLDISGNVIIGSSYYTEYNYTLIFNKDVAQKNIALDSVTTRGFFVLYSGTMPTETSLDLPVGEYVNIGESPNGNKYNLLLNNNDDNITILINKIC